MTLCLKKNVELERCFGSDQKAHHSFLFFSLKQRSITNCNKEKLTVFGLTFFFFICLYKILKSLFF